jgi:hypothetical protein
VICGKRLPLKYPNKKTCSVVCRKEDLKRYAKQYYFNIRQDASRLEKFKARHRKNVHTRLVTDPEFRKRLHAYLRKHRAERKKDPEYVAKNRAYQRKYDVKRRKNPEYLAKRRAYDAKMRSNPEYLRKKRIRGRLKCVSDNLVGCIVSIQTVASTIGKVLSFTKGGENVSSSKERGK